MIFHVFLVFCTLSFPQFLQHRFAFKDHRIPNKNDYMFYIFSLKTYTKYQKTYIFCWSNKLEFDVFFTKNCLTWLDLAWMVRQKQPNHFHSTLTNFSRKLMQKVLLFFREKKTNFNIFPKFCLLSKFCTYKTNTTSTRFRSFYKISDGYPFSYCARVTKLYVFSTKTQI